MIPLHVHCSLQALSRSRENSAHFYARNVNVALDHNNSSIIFFCFRKFQCGHIVLFIGELYIGIQLKLILGD